MKYVKIRSWHIWDKRFVSRGGQVYKTLCGRRPKVDAAQDKDLNVNEKSCERCLQLDAR
jgi:hypothetical protein